MKVMTAQEAEKRFGLSSEELDALEEDAANGILHGEPRGEVVIGRPPLFDERMRQVSFKEPESKVAAIDKRAAQLGMKRSDYLRRIVDDDLALAGMA